MSGRADEQVREIIIVKRRGGGHGDEHHGGVWKIAFADFMTAMMAFFLVLWIVNSTSKATRSSIARYFNPVQLANTTPARKGLQQPRDTDFDAASPTVSGDRDSDGAVAPEPTARREAGPPREPPVTEARGVGPAKGAGKPGDPPPVDRSPTLDEASLAERPQEALDAITGENRLTHPAPRTRAEARVAGTPQPQPQPFRDPFEAMTGVPALSATAGRRVIMEEPQAPRPPDPSAETGIDPPAQAGRKADSGQKAEAPRHEDKAEPPGREQGRMEAGRTQGGGEPAPEVAARPGQAPERLEAELARALSEVFAGAPSPALEVRRIDEGVLISLTDRADFEMFAISSSEPHPQVVKLLGQVAAALAATPGAIVLRGHTDARPWRSRASDNWRLSASRAQIAYQMLLRGRLDPARVERIEAVADRALRRPDAPLAAENRRIEILLRPARDGARP